MNASISPTPRKTAIGWSLYDWANSAYATIILTFVYSVFFSKTIIGDDVTGGAYWSYAIAISGVLIALSAPILGAVADYAGHTKKWIGFFTLVCAMATAGLYIGKPDAGSTLVFLILLLVVISTTALELALVFYNALLPRIAPPTHIGRISGWAWACGYIGGLLALGLCLYLLTGLGERLSPLLDIPADQDQNIRASAILTALWFLIFSIPFFIFVPETKPVSKSLRQAIGDGLRDLKVTFASFRKSKNIMTFLIASALYRDGLATLFALGGIYAATTYDMSFTDILIFAVGLNMTAGLGAFGFSFLDDAIGSKKTVIYSLSCLILSGVVVLFAPSKSAFLITSLFLGLFVGPVQAASRTLAGRLAPVREETKIYGFYALTGKSIAFLGPLSYGFFSTLFQTQKAGLVSILLFWSAGLVLMYFVRETKSDAY
ncbi:MAG: MFS transporter [Micavibrio sp.]|nr:MFS transporter [Micavibrio sp.]